MVTTSVHAARVLDIGDEATLEDVRRARRELAMKYHPDRTVDTDRSTRHMARINAATDTLIAHLKNPVTSKPASVRTDRPDFCADKKTEQSSTGPRVSSHNSVSPNCAAHTPKHTAEGQARSHNQERTAQANKRLKRAGVPSGAELALVRLASASYREVLDQIFRADCGSTVDIRTLSFSTTR